MKFTVERNKWLRGQGAAQSDLLNSAGKMCCLGFYSLACGLRYENILHVTSPASIDDSLLTGELSKLVELSSDGYVNTPDCLRLMIINDDVELTDNQREARLKILFTKLNIEVEFL